MEYTFTFEQNAERKFNEVLSRLEPNEYTIIKDILNTEPDKSGEIYKQTIIEMDPEAALTFRFGMDSLKIRRKRTEEELAEEQELNDRNTIRVNVQVPMGPQTP
jgi:hypothetical protein